MPPIAAAVGAIGSAIAGAGAATVSAAGSALGGLAAAGAGAVTGIGNLLENVKLQVPKVLGIARTGREIFDMFDKPENTSAQKTAMKTTRSESGFVPTNILSTLPQILKEPQPQILTTPPAKEPVKKPNYLLLIGIAALGYLFLRK